MRVSTSLIFQQGAHALQQLQAQVTKTQQQIATGQRILTPADDPAGAKRILDLNQTLALNQQFQANADAATHRLSLEDTSLEGVSNLLQRVRELTIQGLNATNSDRDRQAIAVELEQRLDELLGLANTKDGNNEYLFAGNATRTQPFERPNGTGVTYQGDEGQRQIPIGPGYAIAAGDPGSEVFVAIPNGNGTFVTQADPSNRGSGVIDVGTVADFSATLSETYTVRFSSQDSYEVLDGSMNQVATGTYTSGEAIDFFSNQGIQTAISGAPQAGDSFTVAPSRHQDMFQTLQNLIDAFRGSTSDEAGRAQLAGAGNRGLAELDQAMENVLEIRAGVGARLNAIDSEKAVNEDFSVHLSEALSKVKDVDLVEAISLLNEQLAGLQAAQQSFVRVQNLSLFNFL
jgi:flagellar hook-associated protein 3 FlgL